MTFWVGAYLCLSAVVGWAAVTYRSERDGRVVDIRGQVGTVVLSPVALPVFLVAWASVHIFCLILNYHYSRDGVQG